MARMLLSRPPAAGALGALGDAALAVRAARGDMAAFGELARRAAPAIRAVLRRMGAPGPAADDLTQDALMAALRYIGAYRGDGPFAAWTCRIAARLYLKQVKKAQRTVLMAEPISPETPAAPAPAGERLDLDRALAALSPAERLCVTLCHGAGYTQEEIAAQAGMPLGTVKSHVTRGVRKLRLLMQDG